MLDGVEIPERVVERLKERISVDENGCWNWTGALQKGYGRITWSASGRKVFRSSHRTMYQALVGAIPDELDLDHLCRNRACCNPEHLEPVTRQTNLLRGDTIPAARAARTRCPNGHPYDEENTLTDKYGRRSCRTCTYERNRAYYWKNRERRNQYNRDRRKAKREIDCAEK